MQKAKKFIIRNCASIIVLMLLIAPVFSFAAEGSWKGLIPCSNTLVNDDGTVTPAGTCDFKALMTLINTVIRFILFKLVVPIAAVMFFYAGFLLVTSGGSAEAKGKAKNIFTNAVLGLVIAVAAWLIISAILSILGYNGVWIGFPK